MLSQLRFQLGGVLVVLGTELLVEHGFLPLQLLLKLFAAGAVVEKRDNGRDDAGADGPDACSQRCAPPGGDRGRHGAACREDGVVRVDGEHAR